MARTRKTSTRFAAVIGLTLMATAVFAQQAALTISPRDQVAVAVFGVERLTGKFPVEVDGSMNYPLLGPVQVAGLTTREVEAELGRRLTEGGFFTVTPQITVDLEQTPNKRVTVTGAVRSGGQIMFAGELTLLDAIVRAGSPTPEAGDEALVVRQGGLTDGATGAEHDASNVITVNLRELQSGNVAEHNVTLHDGDLVIVQRAQSVYVSGQVRSPGAVRIETGATVLQVLALAGGLNERGTNRGLRILRNKEEVEDVTLETVVRPGDTIIVRASPW
ncbi:MAG: polysaccharide biosynthesis/export family protein [Vicinamibacterales bacterium]